MTREELIKIAEQLINNGCSEELKEALVKEYPELAKSKDEHMLDGLLEDLKSANFEERYIISVSEWINGLISLHTDSGWKPSEEQMNALNALNCHGDLSYVGQQNQLISLYNDLKKLM